MNFSQFDVVGVGNAIVDVLANSDEEFLQRHNLIKGVMTLTDREAAAQLYGEMCNPVVQSGGSAANTIASLASMGGSCAFIGKVNDDDLGKSFSADIRSHGVIFDTPYATDLVPTAQCLIFVTPDAQRTMQTYLGACVELGPGDIDLELIRASKIIYLEGYLWDPEAAKEALLLAASTAHKSGNRVSLSLSDPFCVERNRDEFVKLVKEHVDLLFANEEEIIALYKVERFEDAIKLVCQDCEIAALTRGPNGSVIVSGDEIHNIPAAPANLVVDTTGAGDAFAAGFLYGIIHNLGLREAGRIGGVAAAEVISHMGGRPSEPLGSLIKHKF